MVLWGNPIIVYQMPKTGSASITYSLNKIGLQNIFHIHNLNPNAKYPFAYSKKLSSLLTNKINNKNTKIKVITGVRDPIARNISDVFQILKVSQKFQRHGLIFPFTFSAADKFLNKNMNMEQIQELFFENYPYHDLPLTWFDEHIKRNLDIDIFSYDFPKDKGYLKIAKENIELLILKLENNSLLKEEQISRFIENNKFKLIWTNITSEDDFSYSDFYGDFKQTVTISSGYLEKMYDSKFVRHFYSLQEIESMKSFWSRTHKP